MSSMVFGRATRPGPLSLLALVLVVATLLVPWPLASWWAGSSWTGPHDLAHGVADGLVRDWTRHVASPGGAASSLADPTRFWQSFHLVKAALAALLLLVSTLLTFRVWSARTTAAASGTPAGPTAGPAPEATGSRFRRAARLLGGTSAAALAGVALLALVANVQGAVAPLSSVLSFLPPGSSDPTVVATVKAVGADLAAAPWSAATTSLVRDFAAYHAAMAVLGAATTAVLAGVVALLWRRRRRAAGTVVLLPALAFALVTAANVGTAAHPAPALGAFLRGVAG